MSRMQTSQFQITQFQIFAIATLSLTGPVELRFPQMIAENLGIDSGYILFLYGLMLMIPIYIISQLSLKFPDKTFFQYLSIIFHSKRYSWLGRGCCSLIVLLLVADILLILSIAIRTFIEPMTDLFLYTTPNGVLLAITILVLIFVSTYRLSTIAGLNQLIWPLIICFMIFLLSIAFTRGYIEFLFPIFQQDVLTKISIPQLQTAFAGMELLLIYSGFYKNKANLTKINMLALGVAIFCNCLFVFSSLSVFGVDELVSITWPILDIFEESWFFVGLMLFFYFFICFVYVINCLTALKMLLRDWIGHRFKRFMKNDWFLLLFSPLIYILAMYPTGWTFNYPYYYILGWISAFLSLILPVLLWIFVKIRGIKGGVKG